MSFAHGEDGSNTASCGTTPSERRAACSRASHRGPSPSTQPALGRLRPAMDEISVALRRRWAEQAEELALANREGDTAERFEAS